jgi:hypothetical protein
MIVALCVVVLHLLHPQAMHTRNDTRFLWPRGMTVEADTALLRYKTCGNYHLNSLGSWKACCSLNLLEL